MRSEDYLFEVVVGVVRCQKRGFLLVRRSENESLSGKWEFGGGAVEDNEGLEEAVKREMNEETDLKPDIVEKGDPYFDEYSKGGTLKLHPFLLQVDEEDEVELSHEHDKHKWLEIKDLDKFETVGELKAIESLGLVK
jgi:mutator protein MutT